MTSEIHELFKQSRRPTAKHEHYFAIYDELFAPFKGKDITFVEIGILGGGSLEAWRKYFGPKARVIGIDLNPVLKTELERDGFEVFIGDQADPTFWRDFFAKVGRIDVLLDDGGHTNTQTWTTVTQALNHVNDGGLIAVEDTHTAYKESFGNPSRSSLAERLFACVNELNYRSPELDDNDRSLRRTWETTLLRDIRIADRVHSIRFYESLFALSIDSRKCIRSRRTLYGSTDQLPGGQQPEDFRSRGIRESIAHRVRKRVRRLARRLPFR
jgi:hypothetical protein